MLEETQNTTDNTNPQLNKEEDFVLNKENGQNNTPKTAETENTILTINQNNTIEKEVKSNLKDRYEYKNGRFGLKKGVKIALGRKAKKPFSLREDLIKSLRQIKKKNSTLYKEIIESYWVDGKMRQFLLEIVDGKARQSVEMSGTMENPVRVIEVKQIDEPINEANSVAQ